MLKRLGTGVLIRRKGMLAPIAAAGPAPYVGPLDEVPGADGPYGVRALSAAWLGENLFRLRRDSDDAEMDFAADAVTGEAPVAAIATWLGGSDGFLVTWYHQNGGTNATQATSANQPQYSASGANSKPVFTFSGTQWLVVSGMTIGPNFTTFVVGHSDDNLSNLAFWGQNGTFSPATSYFDVESGKLGAQMFIEAPEEYTQVGEDASGTTEGQFYVLSGACVHNAATLHRDNTQLAVNADYTASAPDAYEEDLAIGAANAAGDQGLIGGISEVLIYNSGLSGANQSTLRTNELTYFDL